jgi:signal peptidase
LIGRLIDRLLTSLIVTLAVVAVGIGILVFVANLHFQTVTSGSMRPTVSPGDMVITQTVPASSLRVGDVIVFFPPTSSTEPVMHRIVSMDNGVIKTRGDANNVDDPWQVTLTGTTAYRLVAVVPFLGWLTELQRPALIVAGLLVGLAILLELRKEVRGRTTKARSQPQA